MKIIAILRVAGYELGASGSGFQPRYDHAADRVIRGWKPLPQSIALTPAYSYFKLKKSFFFEQTGRFSTSEL
jgi:hypothetical protein